MSLIGIFIYFYHLLQNQQKKFRHKEKISSWFLQVYLREVKTFPVRGKFLNCTLAYSMFRINYYLKQHAFYLFCWTKETFWTFWKKLLQNTLFRLLLIEWIEKIWHFVCLEFRWKKKFTRECLKDRNSVNGGLNLILFCFVYWETLMVYKVGGALDKYLLFWFIIKSTFQRVSFERLILLWINVIDLLIYPFFVTFTSEPLW